VPPDCFALAVQDFRADAEAEFMESLAKLSGLSQAQKAHLIHSLWSIIGELRQEVSGLREQAHRLEIEKTSLQAQAAKHSSNSSTAGRLGMPRFAAYCASKFAVIGFTQSLAHEVAEHKINVNAVCPSTTLTERTGYITAALNKQDAPTRDATQSMVNSSRRSPPSAASPSPRTLPAPWPFWPRPHPLIPPASPYWSPVAYKCNDKGNPYMSRIVNIDVVDLRVPTSDTLLGSDPFHKKPNYSSILTTLNTDDGLVGTSVNFTAGAGNDWIAYGVRDLAQLTMGQDLEDFAADPGAFYKLLIDHHQLRWLADGVARMAIGSIINAMWDLWAKKEGKPLWQLLVDLSPEKIVQSIDWRYLRDVLTPEEALGILQKGQDGRADRQAHFIRKRGPKAYSTAGWLGLTDQQIADTINEMKTFGFDCFKMKVGQNLQHDRERLRFIRKTIGDDALMMLDANQIWGVDEAIAYMEQLAEFRPHWIEEPTARDDVFGYRKITEALAPHGIGVACGEQVPSPVIFKQLLQSQAIKFCQIDATRLGGVNDVLAVILMAAKHQTLVCPHGGGIGLCNMICHYALWDQIAIAAHSDGQVVEYLNFLQDGVFNDPIRVADGCYITPTQPGWNLEMHPDFVTDHTYPSGAVWQGREDSGAITFLA
jgi:L-fuconate dehydratase